ncbi:MAG: PAS domain S-box protein [Chloroflexi bacterium]|nr:PAS domain S-box protein [Chloroflexota bacterium]
MQPSDRVASPFSLPLDGSDIIDVIEEGIVLLDTSGCILFTNPAAAQMLGSPPELLVGRQFHQAFHHSLPDGQWYAAEDSPVLACLVDGTVHRVSGEVFWRSDGTSFPTEHVSSPLRHKGKVVGVVLSFHDISARLIAAREQTNLLKQAATAETKFRSLLEAAPDAVVITNERGAIVLVNRQAEETFGYNRDEMLGQSVEMLMPPRYRLAHLRHRAWYQRDARTRPMGVGLDLHAQRRDGSVFPVEISLSPVTVGGELLIFAMVRDITERLHVREALRDSEERFRLLVQDVENYAIYRLTPQGVVTSWNAGAERLLGYSEAEAVGRSFASFHPIDAASQEWVAAQLRAAEQGGRHEDESWLMRRDGTRFYANTVITVLRDERAQLRGFAVVARDMTAQRRADEERTRLLQREQLARQAAERLAAEREAMLNHIADGVITADSQGRVTYSNVAARRLLGRVPLGVSQESVVRDAPDGDSDVLAPLRKASEAGIAALNEELTVQRHDGTLTVLQSSAAPVQTEDGQRLGAVMTLHDVTAAREVEREKDEFLANVSHDLRTPLGAIRMSIGALLANEPPELVNKLHRLLINIDAASERMAKLVDDLLELSRLQAGRVQLRVDRCDLRSVVRHTLRTIEPLCEARRQRIVSELPPRSVWVTIDRERIERAVVNLLSNAQKYGRDGGTVTVSLHTHEEQVELAVSDDGEGIAPADCERIFDRFYRAPGAQPNQGSGLGLPIARGMVELHGGTLSVESTLGKGSTFLLRLPLEKKVRRVRGTTLKDDSAGAVV